MIQVFQYWFHYLNTGANIPLLLGITYWYYARCWNESREGDHVRKRDDAKQNTYRGKWPSQGHMESKEQSSVCVYHKQTAKKRNSTGDTSQMEVWLIRQSLTSHFHPLSNHIKNVSFPEWCILCPKVWFETFAAQMKIQNWNIQCRVSIYSFCATPFLSPEKASCYMPE